MALTCIRNEQRLWGILLKIVLDQSARVGDKYTNVGGKWTMRDCSVGGKWSEE